MVRSCVKRERLIIRGVQFGRWQVTRVLAKTWPRWSGRAEIGLGMMTREFVWLSCANWRRFWIALFAVLLLSSGWGSSVSAAAAETVTGATPKVSDTTPVVGQELTAIPGAWGPEPVSFSYQWFKGSTAIGGATSATYTCLLYTSRCV